ncbi:MAG: gamma-glutamyltransferase family protein, partial [Rhodospirillales bacterium]|nr:gamma-glutamyltransferase family protein [Rhodospirillales bacterium]
MKHGMVVAAQPEAVEAGVEVLAAGGNAVDAAIATALTQTAVDPQMCGIAGFGCLHVHAPDGRQETIDFYARVPQAATPDMWAAKLVGESDDGFGFFLSDRSNELGYGAIATPGTLRGFETALARHGTRRFGDLVEPAIRHARDGVMVRPHMAAYWGLVPTEAREPHQDFLSAIPATAKIYMKDGVRAFKAGEILRNPDMAATLERLAKAGPADFFEGAVARDIAADMAAHGGLVSARDLAEAKARIGTPLRGTYRGHEIVTNPPPGGGVKLLEMLNILENFDLAGMGHNSPDYIATIAEAMKIGAVDRDATHGDPEFLDVPVARLTSKEYAAGMAARIKRGEKTHVPRMAAKEAADTTQVCVVDRAGMCVSLTHTLGTPSGVVTEGLGFMYNGAMGAFDPRPGRAGSIAPGKARMSSMAPTMVYKNGKPFFIVGAPGGTYITVGILQAILNAVDFGMNALEAV